ncbi:hypothetical protein KUTeg_002933 [Tegillarca granosa]|uniref:Protein Wnt n=1 Tax=Tegillarca granosa TaxID=220873 RepID=A0ABQ9FKL0_TEGGR|nr:hypothetical protein KUTeg_002933 [Tegillarca granosa]
MDECRYQFKWERWNCPDTDLPLVQQNMYLRVNRETAYLQSINSAGVMYTLTEKCSTGVNKICGCDFSRNGKKGGYNWQWGGCSDNIKYGESMTKRFLDAMISGKDAHAAMNRQNNGAGRKAVKKTARLICKCHGVSGSCSVRTCWQQLAKFRSVGFYLKRKYRKAIHVNFYGGKLEGNEARGMKMSLFSDKDLVFLEKSPDYCKQNFTFGTKGTVGRECSQY